MTYTPLKMKLDGVEVPTPKIVGIDRKLEKIWSNNTGRSASQKMNGTIKAIIPTKSISWPPLTKAERDLLETYISNKGKPFVWMELTQPDGTVEKTEVYFGTPSCKEWNQIGGVWRCEDYKVDAIGR